MRSLSRARSQSLTWDALTLHHHVLVEIIANIVDELGLFQGSEMLVSGQDPVDRSLEPVKRCRQQWDEVGGELRCG